MGRFLTRIGAAISIVPMAVSAWRDQTRQQRQINKIFQGDIADYSRSDNESPFVSMFVLTVKKFLAGEIPVATIGYSPDGKSIGDIGLRGENFPPLAMGGLIRTADIIRGQVCQIDGLTMKKINVIFQSQQREIYIRYDSSACLATAGQIRPAAMAISKQPFDDWDVGRTGNSSSQSLWQHLREIGEYEKARGRSGSEFAHAIKGDLAKVNLSAIKSPNVRCLIDWLVKFSRNQCDRITIGYNTVSPANGQTVDAGEYFGMERGGDFAMLGLHEIIGLLGENSRKRRRDPFMMDMIFDYKCDNATRQLTITEKDYERMPREQILRLAEDPTEPMHTIVKTSIATHTTS